jgi:hypothetical protein
MIDKLSLSCTNYTQISNTQKPKLHENYLKSLLRREIKKNKKIKNTWFLRCKSNPLLANEGIDKRRLADIGATQNGKLGPVIFGTVLGPRTALQELHLPNPGVTRVGSDHDVGSGQDHLVSDLIQLDPGRHEQDGPDEPGRVGHWWAPGGLGGRGRIRGCMLGRVPAAGRVGETGWETESETCGFTK